MFASSVDEFMSAACRGERSDELTKTFGAFLVQLYFTLMKYRAVDADELNTQELSCNCIHGCAILY